MVQRFRQTRAGTAQVNRRGTEDRRALARARRSDAAELSDQQRARRSRGTADGRFWPIVSLGRFTPHVRTAIRYKLGMLLTERDAAVRLRITLDDLNAMIEAAEIRYLVIAGQVRFTPDAIQDAVRRMEVKSRLKEPN